jgi:ABC-type amino acid transport substrate-binding protein
MARLYQCNINEMKETGEYDEILVRWFGHEARVLRMLFEPEK